MSGVNHMISAEDIKTLKENVNALIKIKECGWEAVQQTPNYKLMVSDERFASHANFLNMWHMGIPKLSLGCSFTSEIYDNLDPFLTTLLNILEKIDKPVSDIAGNVAKEVVLDERIEEDYDDDL